MGKGLEGFEMHVRKTLDCLEGTIGRNANIKGASGKVSDRKEEHVIGNWREGDLVPKWQRTWLNCVLMF